jgi:hypothetical protein
MYLTQRVRRRTASCRVMHVLHVPPFTHVFDVLLLLLLLLLKPLKCPSA